MNNIKCKVTIIAMLVIALVATSLVVPVQASAATKNIIVQSFKGNTLTCRKAVGNKELMPDAEWENIVGTGKAQKITVSKNCKYYVLSMSSLKLLKVSKASYKKKLYEFRKNKSDGVTYYTGQAAKLTIKGGKCVKIVQVFQS